MTILNIVQMYRLACLRLTERCADMLISIRYEVHEAGDVVAEELALPITRLEE
jgi:abelson tyrosine-protein kinase 1